MCGLTLVHSPVEKAIVRHAYVSIILGLDPPVCLWASWILPGFIRQRKHAWCPKLYWIQYDLQLWASSRLRESCLKEQLFICCIALNINLNEHEYLNIEYWFAQNLIKNIIIWKCRQNLNKLIKCRFFVNTTHKSSANVHLWVLICILH